MNLRSLVPMTALAVTCLGVASGTANGAPAVPVTYEATMTSNSIVTVLHDGTFGLTADGSAVSVTDKAGNLITNIPLTIPYANTIYPVAQHISENNTKLELTPVAKPVSAVANPLPVTTVATNEENDMAKAAFMDQFRAPQVGIGAILGGLVGLVAGCVIGLPLWVIGCVPVGLAGTALGATTGAAIAGGEPLFSSINDVYITLIGAPWTSPFYKNPNNGLALIDPPAPSAPLVTER